MQNNLSTNPTFNQTRMELKHLQAAGRTAWPLTFNQTRMELKPKRPDKPATLTSSFNQTRRELKRIFNCAGLPNSFSY